MRRAWGAEYEVTPSPGGSARGKLCVHIKSCHVQLLAVSGERATVRYARLADSVDKVLVQWALVLVYIYHSTSIY